MKTLFDKIWDAHVVTTVKDGPTQLYIDRHLCHEVTSPQAFSGLRARGLNVFRPEQTLLTADHNIPTTGQDKPIQDEVSRFQVDTLAKNAREFGLTYYGLRNSRNGIVHVIGPENGFTQPGMTIVCGDSQQTRPKTMRVNFRGTLQQGVSAKDMALYMIWQLTTGGATGYFVEYAGEAVRNLTMEQRMTLCNLSIEMGARGGLIAPDETTYNYLREREFAPKGERWDKAMAYWKTLKSDDDAVFDKEVTFDASQIKPMITYGTNPGMGMPIDGSIPELSDIDEAGKISFEKSLKYMGFEPGQKLAGKPIDYVFLGSCTNGRIEDFRLFTQYVKGKKKAGNVTAWLVPGSWQVRRQIEAEGLDKILEEAGFELRQPGCSACLAMNDDKVPAGKYAVSTSNRNFEGRQGPGARTILASPLVAAAAAVSGKITAP